MNVDNVNRTKVIISGQCPSHKNSKRIFKTGGRTVIANSKAYLEWKGEAIKELMIYKSKSLLGKVQVDCEFYNKDARARDLDNMLSSVMDALKEAHIIEDDNCHIVPMVTARLCGISRNPRVEITITKLSDDKTAEPAPYTYTTTLIGSKAGQINKCAKCSAVIPTPKAVEVKQAPSTADDIRVTKKQPKKGGDNAIF